MKLTAEEFVIAWQTASSKSELIKATGMSYGAINLRAWKLRKLGVPMRKFKSNGPSPLDIAALTKLAKQHAPKS